MSCHACDVGDRVHCQRKGGNTFQMVTVLSMLDQVHPKPSKGCFQENGTDHILVVKGC